MKVMDWHPLAPALLSMIDEHTFMAVWLNELGHAAVAF